MKGYAGVKVELRSFLFSALGGDMRLASRPSRSTPMEGVVGAHGMEGCGGSHRRTGSSREWNHDCVNHIALSLSTVLGMLSRLPITVYNLNLNRF
jgi:hypothetical protein